MELGGNIFNLLNDGNYTQYNYNGANERFNTRTTCRCGISSRRAAFQATAVFRF